MINECRASESKRKPSAAQLEAFQDLDGLTQVFMSLSQLEVINYD